MLIPPMHTVDLEDIPADSPLAAEGRRLVRAGRLWGFRSGTPGRRSAEALVLGGDGEPMRISLDEESWDCECRDGRAGRPCVHLTALLCRMASERPDDGALGPFGGDSTEAERRRPDLDPQQDLLFFSEPIVREEEQVLVLGPRDEVNAVLAGEGDPSPADDETVFRDFSHRPWTLRRAVRTIREDGVPGRLRPCREAVDPSPLGPADLRTSEHPVLRPDGRPWRRIEARSARLRFEPVLGKVGDEALYEPIGELDTGSDLPPVGGALTASDGVLIALDVPRGLMATLENPGDALWLMRLVLSRKVMSASDIRARFAADSDRSSRLQVLRPEETTELENLEPRLVLNLSGRDDRTELKPEFRYGAATISPSDEGTAVNAAAPGEPPRIGRRKPGTEAALLDQAETILAADLQWRRGRYASMSGDPSIPLVVGLALPDLLAEYAAALMDVGIDVRLENRPIRPGLRMVLRTGRRGEALTMNAVVVPAGDGEADGEFDLDPWLERAGLVRTREAYFTLTGKALEQLRFLRNHGMDDTGFLSTSPDNLGLIDAVYDALEAEDAAGLDLEAKRALYRSLAEFDANRRVEAPQGFTAELRPYQQTGVAWLRHLESHGLGACLADDMGLGKTVQTLAYLLHLKNEGRLGMSLLVGPVVTLTNWIAEIRRFSPQISHHSYSGPADRRSLPSPSSEVDLVIVSYQTLRNDAEKFLDRDWDHVILDEAHYVKNASSRTFKTVRSLRARQRLSLTGTPLENHLGELWSQMSFLNPGLLGGRSAFTERFRRPVEKDGDEEALRRLSGIVSPFVLRRRKADVLNELPPKDEAVLRCQMSPAQAEAYERTREAYSRRLTGLLSGGGLQAARIEIFSILSKLRLLAIHPPLAGEPFTGIDSGKMTALDGLLDEILEEDHKTLVFSQFLGALDRAEDTCRRRGWGYSRLTGSTSDREEQIRRFQDDPDNRVFLLSLKAGGVGINLTAADYVVLVDPWWNPAVESQAVDRAHRMGQSRSVMVYRLITSGTIEERVLELQESKRRLVAGVLGDGGIRGLSDEDILNLLR